MGSGSIAHEIPWLWYRLVVKANVPPWLPSVLLFISLYAVGLIGAALAGELPKFVRDIRWLVPLGLPGLTSLILTYAPRILDRLWSGLAPWLSNTEAEIEALRASAPRLLTRFFWPIGLFLTALVGQFIIVGNPGNWTQDYQNPQFFAAITLIAAPFVGYFVGGAASIATIGLGALLHRMSHTLRFRTGFTLEGGKSALQPINELLWLIWAVMMPTLLLVLVANTALSPATLENILATVTAIVVALGSVMVPQLFMNRLLRGAKERELGALRDELKQVSALPAYASADQGMQGLLRQGHLLYQLHCAETFRPTLIDLGFTLQILVSVTAILVANVVMRTFLTRLLP